jgi:hypothetical protein
MINKKLIPLLIIILLLTACSEQQKEEIDTTAMIEKALLDELFQVTEKLIEDIENKDYVEANDKIAEIYELSSQSGFTPMDSFENSEKYFDALNALTTSIDSQANIQKLNEIYYAYEKSIIELAAKMDDESGESSSGSSDSGDSSDSSKDQKDSSLDTSASSSSSSEDSEKGEEDSSSSVIIIQEELLNKYPELITTMDDKEIKNAVVVLLDYISQKILEADPGDEQAILKRQKVYFYSAASLADLNKFNDAILVMESAENEWDAFLLQSASEDKSEIKTLSTVIKNTTESLTIKNAISVDIQKDIAIKAIDDLSDKLISEAMKEKS